MKQKTDARKEQDGRSKAFSCGYAAALADLYRNFKDSSGVRITAASAGMTLAVFERDDVEPRDLAALRKAGVK